MATLSSKGIDPVVVERVLRFLNDVQTPEDITTLTHFPAPISDSPNDFFIGELVAGRILEKRAAIGGTFTDLAEMLPTGAA